jgi:hypothetical protein
MKSKILILAGGFRHVLLGLDIRPDLTSSSPAGQEVEWKRRR